MDRYCLIISCSDRKHETPKPMPALEVYNGYSYRILKKLMREGRFPQSVDILILSAKYGLLKPEDKILSYDLKMTKARAEEIREQILDKLASQLTHRRYSQIFINLGKDYLPVISGLKERIPTKPKFVFAEGGLGQKGSEMKQWLLKKLANNATDKK